MYAGNIFQIEKELVSLPELLRPWLKKLSEMDIESLVPGRYELENGCYMNVDQAATEPEENRKWEAHEEYIDIQFVISGNERIEYLALNEMEEKTESYPERDLYFYRAKKGTQPCSVSMSKGRYAVFYPADAHRPLCMADKPEAVKKIVMKIRL